MHTTHWSMRGGFAQSFFATWVVHSARINTLMIDASIAVWTIDIMFTFSFSYLVTSSEPISGVSWWALTSCSVVINGAGGKFDTRTVCYTWVHTVAISTCLADGTIIVRFTIEGFRFDWKQINMHYLTKLMCYRI